MTHILGIETSCDETAASVIEHPWTVRSSVVASQMDIHAEYGGVVPEIASRHHAERILPVLMAAIQEAGITPKDISAVAIGHRPGLIGCLLVGISAAKAVAWSLDIPIVGVDHVHAHVFSGLLQSENTASPSPLLPPLPPPPPRHDLFPAIGFVASGGHTAMYQCNSIDTITRLGATIDDALGEAYDKAATMLGLAYPGGPKLDALAQTPGADPSRFSFPVSRLSPTSLDFSFSGLKTALLYAIRGTPQRDGTFVRDFDELTDTDRTDLACAFQHAASSAVVLKLERAINHVHSSTGSSVRSLFVGGGVSANSRIREQLTLLCERRDLRLVLPPMEYCVDNAAMIGGLGGALLERGCISDLRLRAHPASAL